MTKIEELKELIRLKGTIFAVHQYDVPAPVMVVGALKQSIVMYVSEDGSTLVRNPYNKARSIKSVLTEDIASAILDKHQKFLDGRANKEFANAKVASKRAEKLLQEGGSVKVTFKPTKL